MDVVPATWTVSPTRTAREYPMRSSGGAPDEMFSRLAGSMPDARKDNGRAFADIRATVARILTRQAPREGREKAWKDAARFGELFLEPELILPYQGAQWMRGLEALRKATDSRKALEKHIFRFFQAAAAHRTFVLRDLLVKHGLVVD